MNKRIVVALFDMSQSLASIIRSEVCFALVNSGEFDVDVFEKALVGEAKEKCEYIRHIKERGANLNDKNE